MTPYGSGMKGMHPRHTFKSKLQSKFAVMMEPSDRFDLHTMLLFIFSLVMLYEFSCAVSGQTRTRTAFVHSHGLNEEGMTGILYNGHGDELESPAGRKLLRSRLS